MRSLKQFTVNKKHQLLGLILDWLYSFFKPNLGRLFWGSFLVGVGVGVGVGGGRDKLPPV